VFSEYRVARPAGRFVNAAEVGWRPQCLSPFDDLCGGAFSQPRNVVGENREMFGLIEELKKHN
jgi:hypothetical protein